MAVVTTDGDEMALPGVVITREGSKAKAQRMVQNFPVQGKRSLERAAPPKSPEDFVAAIRGALDKFHVQLSSMTYAGSNFAVKEFQLDSNVHAEVSLSAPTSF